MKRTLLIILFATTMRAAEIEAGAAHVIAVPRDRGTLDIEVSRGFAAHAEVFFSDALSTRVAATFLNPAAILFPEDPPPSDVDLGTLGMDVYSATARYHFAPRARLSGFAGAGGALVVLGDLDDQFGTDVEVELDPELTLLGEGGLRYRFRERIILEMSVAYMPLEADSQILRAGDPRYPVPETVTVNPLIVSVGAAWRF